MTKNVNKFLFIVIALIVPFLSCRKETSLVGKTSKQIEEHFFQKNLSNDQDEKKIIDYIRRINEKSNFVQKIYENIGYPIWNKAIKCPQITNNNTGIKSFSISDLKKSDTTINYIIPFVREEQSHVNAAMFINTTSTDTTITYLCDWQYSQFNNNNLRSNQNPENIALFFMRFDNNVFNSDCFKILDTSLFSLHNKVANVLSINSNSSQLLNPESLSQAAFCVDITIEYEQWTPGNLLGVFDGECMPCISYVTETFCWTEFFYSGSGSGGGSYFSGGVGGSGSGGFGPYPPPPPPDYIPRWTEDIDNRTGFSKARINELKSKISQNPFELIDCNTINNLNATDGNGPIFPRIASYQVPISVINRISYIRQVAPNWIVDNYNIQSLTKAYGPVVNCDFFPIRIKKLPMGLSPKNFLEYFRKNISSFIDNNLETKFVPYKLGSFDDTEQFNKDFGNSLGSLIHIQMKNSGSVIISDYQNSTNPNAERHYFKFSTMETPKDFSHPVAGNREFGIYEDPNNKGEYIFYISAVDRTWDPLMDFGNMVFHGFDMADLLWNNIQSNLKFFINSLSGEAEYDPRKNIISRPKWEDVEEYLQGKITYQELKKRLGC